MPPVIGNFYEIGTKKIQVQYECQCSGYFGCMIIEDGGEGPFRWRRGQIITLQHTEFHSDFKDAISLKLVRA